MRKNQSKDLMVTVFDLIDAVVEIYLKNIIRPFLSLHEVFYSGLNKVLRQVLDDHKKKIPTWFTANFITYARTWVVFPTILLLAWGHFLLPAILVIMVDLGDFLDGVVARFWNEIKKEKEAMEEKDRSRSTSPTNSDKDSFEVVTTGSPHAVPSWVNLHRARSYGGFVDAVCDKAFVIPCWISLLQVVPNTRFLKLLQYVGFVALILAETASGCIRFRAYFTAGGMPAPKVEGFDFSTSAVTADHIGKAKQTFEMVGTALYMIPLTRYIGLLLLLCAVPLAYESVRRKVKQRVIYVNGNVPTFDHMTLRFWAQVKAMGSKLIVGVPGEKMADKVLNACASTCVDEVIAEAPAKADLMFLEKHNIDFCVVSSASEAKFVTDEVINANRCLVIMDDGVARPLTTKAESKEN